MQGKINRGRHSDHPAGRYSIRTNQCSTPPSPNFLTGRMPFLPPNQQCQSTEGNLYSIIIIIIIQHLYSALKSCKGYGGASYCYTDENHSTIITTITFRFCLTGCLSQSYSQVGPCFCEITRGLYRPGAFLSPTNSIQALNETESRDSNWRITQRTSHFTSPTTDCRGT